MRDMKDSGIEWIGKVPASWILIRLKYASWLKGRIGWQGLRADEFQEEGPYLITGTDFSEGVVNWDTCVHISEERYKQDLAIHIKENDLLVTKDGSIGKVAVAKNCPEKVSLNSGVFIIRNTGNYKYDSRWMYYLIQSREFTLWYELSNSGSSTINHLNQEKFYNFLFAYPSIKEQKKISAYLDKKCNEIRLLCKDIQSQISSLEEYKRSIITEAVTKGLNADVEMKDSGQVWLGKIPSHWMIKPFKYVLMERSHKNNPILTEERLSLSIDKGVTLYAEKTTNLDRFKDDVSQYKLAHKGDLVLNSMNMIVGAVGISNYFGCVSPAYYTYYDNEEEHITARYCEYVFRTPIMRKVLFSLGKGIMAIDRGDGRVNTCRLKVSRDDLRMLHFPVPPISEQRSIVKRLDEICKEVDAIIEEKKQQLATLEQYKKSLIYEYVTGKKEVPNE